MIGLPLAPSYLPGISTSQQPVLTTMPPMRQSLNRYRYAAPSTEFLVCCSSCSHSFSFVDMICLVLHRETHERSKYRWVSIDVQYRRETSVQAWRLSHRSSIDLDILHCHRLISLLRLQQLRIYLQPQPPLLQHRLVHFRRRRVCLNPTYSRWSVLCIRSSLGRLVYICLQFGTGNRREHPLAIVRTVRRRAKREDHSWFSNAEMQRFWFRHDDQLWRSADGDQFAQWFHAWQSCFAGVIQNEQADSDSRFLIHPFQVVQFSLSLRFSLFVFVCYRFNWMLSLCRSPLKNKTDRKPRHISTFFCPCICAHQWRIDKRKQRFPCSTEWSEICWSHLSDSCSADANQSSTPTIVWLGKKSLAMKIGS